MSSARQDSGDIRTVVAGTLGSWPDVVLLPGLGILGYLRPWFERTALWTRVTILDLPGWSRGRATGCPPSVDEVAGAAARWLGANRAAPVALVGHSTGSQAALLAARMVPDRLAGLVLAGPVFTPGGRTLPAMLGQVRATLRYEVWAELPAVLPSVWASGGVPMYRLLRSALRRRPEDLVGDLEVPMALITGAHDHLADPDWAIDLGARCAAPVFVHPGGHNACFAYPDHVDATLREAIGSFGPTAR